VNPPKRLSSPSGKRGYPPRPSAAAETIEIEVAGKYRIRVGNGFAARALRRVLEVLGRR
jgi:hypothetical protein